MLPQNTLLHAHKMKLRWFITLSTLPLLGVVTAFGIMPQTAGLTVSQYSVIENIVLPASTAQQPEASVFWRNDRVQRGDTVGELLRRVNVQDPAADEFLRRASSASSFRQLRVGRTFLAETDDAHSGILYTKLGADGTGAWELYLKIFEIAKAPYIAYDAGDRAQNLAKYPHMNGKKVFLNAVRHMVLATQQALSTTGLGWDDIDWFVPHQANLRINEAVMQYAKIPPDKVLNTIQMYGNTTAAAVPLTIDHWRREGKVKKGDRVLATVFGSGYTWGTAVFQI